LIHEARSNVTPLPVRFKSAPPDAPFLKVESHKCYHGPFVVNTELAHVACEKCGEKLNPLYVLGRLANQERQWHESFVRYQDEMKRLAERSRTKCQHCGKMTRIR
jgi:ribosomal protein S27E